jgi:hypothetical protein
MTDINDLNPDVMRRRIVDIFQASKKLRSWSLTPAALDGLAAYLAARQALRDADLAIPDARKHFELELSVYVPSILRYSASPPPAVPPPWKDPVTGQVALNPFDPAHPDLTSQNILLHEAPELAKHLQRIANGVTYSYLYELRAAEGKAELVNAIPYDADAHKRNPFLTDNRTAQNAMIRENEIKAEVYRAETKPIELPWTPTLNKTILNRALREQPQIGQTIQIAADLSERWREVELERMQQAEAEAKKRIEELQKQQAAIRPPPRVVAPGFH